MKSKLERMMDSFDPQSLDETKSALREIIQNIVLIGLSNGGFFHVGSFYGGTATRIFYDLNRYSEDLDFTLNQTMDHFSFYPYIEKVETTAFSYGLKVEASVKEKKIETPVSTAIVRTNTLEAFFTLKVPENLTSLLHKDEVIKVKFEADCHPALGFRVEKRYIDLPDIAPVMVLDEPSLFAGKLNAVLTRNYGQRVKGRDYYDFAFYVRNRISPNLVYLKNRLVAGGKIKEEDPFDIPTLQKMLIERFEEVDFEEAKEDASKFLFHEEDLSYFQKDYFIDLARKIRA